ncbi:hypothetical protein HK099_002502 [Clydaea vesicula]|uniref:Uncharacterized protein n=1 Tax=Clydaea vesicula TaxID=447962 RepID=A0AAD5U6Y7_9FUNG|nr:hypothetical protein HK099_002502 [Clydaea vesicula]KAJ3380069.1 hypothetical protein HDU92_006216 [Lobulomyces angularis]
MLVTVPANIFAKLHCEKSQPFMLYGQKVDEDNTLILSLSPFSVSYKFQKCCVGFFLPMHNKTNNKRMLEKFFVIGGNSPNKMEKNFVLIKEVKRNYFKSFYMEKNHANFCKIFGGDQKSEDQIFSQTEEGGCYINVVNYGWDNFLNECLSFSNFDQILPPLHQTQQYSQILERKFNLIEQTIMQNTFEDSLLSKTGQYNLKIKEFKDLRKVRSILEQMIREREKCEIDIEKNDYSDEMRIDKENDTKETEKTNILEEENIF